MSIINTLTTRATTKYGITESKKSEIDAIEAEVINAQHKVDQMQTIVNALHDKSILFATYMNEAKETLDTIGTNYQSLDEAVLNASELLQSSDIAAKEMIAASGKTDEQASLSNTVINKLIYSAEVVNKLANMIVRKKALNPLISDELISMVSKAGEDANNAVTLSLVALKSSISAQTTNAESMAISSLEVFQAKKLLYLLTEQQDSNIKVVLSKELEEAKGNYDSLKMASENADGQFNEAKMQLNKATVSLNSLKAGLAAANAAALAS